MSPTSSRRMVPPLARANLPGLSFFASVKAPFTYPNNSDSSRGSGRAPQFTLMKGFACLRPRRVNRFCKEFFSRSARALDQDRAVALGNVGKDIKDFANPMVLTDDISHGVPLGEFFL